MSDIDVIITMAAPPEFPFPEFILLTPSKTQLATTIEYPTTKPLTPFTADHSAVLQLNFISNFNPTFGNRWGLFLINPHRNPIKRKKLIGKGNYRSTITDQVIQHLVWYVLECFKPEHRQDEGSATVAEKEKFSLLIEPHTP